MCVSLIQYETSSFRLARRISVLNNVAMLMTKKVYSQRKKKKKRTKKIIYVKLQYNIFMVNFMLIKLLFLKSNVLKNIKSFKDYFY